MTVSSVVYATDAVPIAPGSHATAPPTATTTNPQADTARRHRVPSRTHLDAPMPGSLPPPHA
ncbi:hypothetical protein ACR6C2_15465 [Streptomyces sp. INA 01156]